MLFITFQISQNRLATLRIQSILAYSVGNEVKQGGGRTQKGLAKEKPKILMRISFFHFHFLILNYHGN